MALFSAPDDVIIDINFLNTLSDSEILSGYGEITKLFLIGGDYYTGLLTSDLDLKELIYHALSIKRSIIQMDEFEKISQIIESNMHKINKLALIDFTLK